jgi:hypothetical protein
MSIVNNPLVQAAIPTAIAVIQAAQQFETDIGTDPSKWVLTVGPAKLKLLGNLGLLLPPLEVAEGSALQGIINTTGDGWIAKLKAAQAPASTSTTQTPPPAPAPALPA